jgi:hypothetical protein
MRQSTQEDPARKRFDCELPTDALTELVAPRRPRILGRKTSTGLNTAAKWPLYLAALIAVGIVGGVALLWRQWETERASSTGAISQPALAPQPTPALTPVPLPPGSADRWKAYLAEQQTRAPRAEWVKPAPRAELVRLPAPRAQLVLTPGEQYKATMPYDNLEVLATFRGWLPSQDDLPSHPNQIGDMYLVGNVPFVWLFPPGASRAGWIDP